MSNQLTIALRTVVFCIIAFIAAFMFGHHQVKMIQQHHQAQSNTQSTNSEFVAP